MYGINYYRLKQVDFDGKYEYSEVKSILFQSDQLAVFPNPASEIIHIRGIEDEISYKLSDMNGLRIMEGITTDGSIPISDLIKGTYILQIHHNGEVTHHKVLKMK